MTNISLKVAQASLICLLFFPMVFIVFLGPKSFNLDSTEFIYSLWHTIKQSAISAFFALILGFLGALGLLHFKHQGYKRRILEFLIILPSMIPGLFVILGIMSVWTMFAAFPFGVWGIVVVHTLMNVGLVSFVLASIIKHKLSPLAELATIEGSTTVHFYKNCGLKFIWQDLSYVFFFVFSLCFTSLSIPMLVGSVKEPVLEILIFEKLRHVSTWPEAIVLSFLQMILLLILAYMIKPYDLFKGAIHKVPEILSKKICVVLPIGISLLILVSNFARVPGGFKIFLDQPELVDQILRQSLFTLALAIGVGVIVALLHFLVLYLYPSPLLRKWLFAYVAPSSVLIGFGLLLMPPMSSSVSVSMFKLVLGMGVLFFPICYRLKGGGALNDFRSQYEVARQMGARHSQIILKILGPQYFHTVMQLAGLSAFWACGEFAVSSIVLSQDYSLSLAVKSFLGSYRFDLAAWYILPLLAVGGVSWGFFVGVGNVYRQKFI